MRIMCLLALMLFPLFSYGADDKPLAHARGLVRPDDWAKRATFVDVLGEMQKKRASLPAAFDWRDTKTLSAVTDQGNCGSCWDFSSASTFRDAMIVQAGAVGDASEKYVLDCNSMNYSCNGGYFDVAQFYISPGAVRQADYKAYNAKKEACGAATPFAKLAEWHYVAGSQSAAPTVDQLKAAIYTYGPINVGVAAGNDWDSYSGGVMTACRDTQLNHAVQLVGWNDNGGTNGYWIMRNSWGTVWGEQGYMRLVYGCDGIGESAVFYVYKGGVPPAPTPTPTPPVPPPCKLPVTTTGYGPQITVQAGKTIVMGKPGAKGVSYKWTAVPAFNGGAVPTTAQINYKPAITKALTITATNTCGSASATTNVVMPYAEHKYYQ